MKNSVRITGIALLLLLQFASAAFAQYSHWLPYWNEWLNMKDAAPKGYVCHRAPAPITIDGEINEPGWKHIPWTDYFEDIEGTRKPVPWFRTQAKMAYDDQYFYVAADLEELDVWGTLTYHDAIMYWDNDFEIFIDPDSDNHHYYELEINALNAVWDLMLHYPYRDGAQRDNEWSVPGLKTAVKVYGTLNDPTKRDRGWSVEFAIPWDVLREYANKSCPPKDGDYWRVDFSRVEYKVNVVDGVYQKDPNHRGENWIWSPPGVISMHCPEKWGYVMFSEGRPGTVEFVPEPTEPARMVLHAVYYAQRDYYRDHGRYAKSMEELDYPIHTHKTVVKGPEITPTADGYTATITVKTKKYGKQQMSINQVSKVDVK